MFVFIKQVLLVDVAIINKSKTTASYRCSLFIVSKTKAASHHSRLALKLLSKHFFRLLINFLFKENLFDIEVSEEHEEVTAAERGD